MGDMAESFNAMREFGRKKKQENLSNSTQVLIDNGIAFESFNNGIHLRVGNFDFWPSTGVYINQKTKRKGRGVFNLLKAIKEAKWKMKV